MTREEAIQNLKDILEEATSGKDAVCYVTSEDAEALNMAIEALSAEAEWIPVSERLPRARESVLLAVNHKYGNWVGEGCYWETTDNHIIWKGYRWNATYWDDEIIAWMPLPGPYREDGEA